MAPKKKHQQQKSAPKSGTKPSPKLQISAENERRLRRLLLNTERAAAATTSSAAAATSYAATVTTSSVAGDNASRAQKAKRLRSVYDKLSLEGFSSDQIEQALSALNVGATFEAALDWLCLNIPGNELPLKFSTGATSLASEERSVRIISTARADWTPQLPQDEMKEEKPLISVGVKGKNDEDFDKSSQADWIRQYLEQQAEQEEIDEQEEERLQDPTSRAAGIVEEYQNARLAALEAKQKKDKKSQEYFGDIIQRLKLEISSLGLSDDILVSRSQNECPNLVSDEMPCEATKSTSFESIPPDSTLSWKDSAPYEGESVMASTMDEISISTKTENAEDAEKKEEPEVLELNDLFSEDSSSMGQLPLELLKQKKKEKIAQLVYGRTIVNFDEIWKKRDSRITPKAALQKICQSLGWEAPKYTKLFEKESKFLYAVNVLRTATGRGKNRKAGGLIAIQLPRPDEVFETVEVAQNKVAAFALYQLFSDLPLCQMLEEPYASTVEKWQEDEFSTKMEDTEDVRRAGFVDSLLDSGSCQPVTSVDVGNDYVDGSFEEPPTREVICDSYAQNPEGTLSVNKGLRYHEQAESAFLKKELEKKMKLPKYMEMLEARSALPIASLKGLFLQMLYENDVIVVCGETGCGKTTQVPQFILDDLIGSGLGGRCNIVCTQPRRIAAISVAERVSDERCESSPGSDGSLVGFQVRLDSARNERTKLLFCTTGILLRKLAGDKDLAGITHVIVDEVHERSLLGDFLLIVLKNLIKKQSGCGGQKLKVILMSATVDSSLFSKYFGNCPVIHAEGRTHPVSTYFLEDIYENLKYSLPSDSPASGTFMMPRSGKPGSSSVDNHRGKKNLVLSAWGDESLLLDDYINPYYIPEAYDSYSERTRKNLKSLNEDVIDFDLLEDLICHIDETYPPGAILVFLPGVAEIDMLVDKLTASFRFGGESANWVLPLHSSLASTDQRKVFLSPPQNTRKVIISTDIAETSITIDDVVYVVDSGKHKENRYNPQKKMSSMVEDWISQANAKQRRGRAGRVKPGICFCLYTCNRYENLMRPFQVPEMLRMPLTELCLQIKSLHLGDIKSVLTEAIEPPREEAISSAIDLLYKVGAFEANEVLSSLGYHLAKLPVDVLIGKMMLYGAIFGCLSPILSIAAFLSYKFPFVYPKDEKQNMERVKSALLNNNMDAATASPEANGQSDHLLLAVSYNKWSKILRENGVKAAQRFCRSFFLNSSVMYMIRDMRIQFGSLLADIGLINLPNFSQNDGKRKDKLDIWFADMSQPFNMYAHHSSIIKSILCAGLYPNVAATAEGMIGTLGRNRAPCSTLSTKDRPVWYDGRRQVHIHPSSVNCNTRVFHYPFLVFLEKVETSKIFLRDTSIISPYSLLLFGGSIVIQHQTGTVLIDNWLKLTAPAQTAVLFKELRATLNAVLKGLIRKPEISTISHNEVMRSIIHLLLEEDKAQCS